MSDALDVRPIEMSSAAPTPSATAGAARSLWLMYHDVTATGTNSAGRGDVYCLGRRRFASHLDALEHSGLPVLAAGDWLARPVEDSIVLTFDDGWTGTFTNALPMVVDRGFRCTIFVTRDFVGRRGGCEPAMLREAVAAGAEIGIHGMTHRMFTTLTPAEVSWEFSACRAFLEDLLGVRVDLASVPGGDWLPWMERPARDAGMRAVSTSAPTINRPSTSAYSLGRIAVRNSHSAKALADICRFRIGRERLRYHALRAPRRILGIRRYERARASVLRATGRISTAGLAAEPYLQAFDAI